jgi:serpin B
MYGTRWSTGIMLGLVTTACLAACNQSKSEPGDQEINAPEPAPAAVLDDGQRTAFAETRMDFAWDLYRNLHELEGNLFFSPYSVSTALAMTYAGARGETAAEMATALGFTLPDDALHAAFAEREQALALAQREGIELSTANRLWGDTSETFLDGFTSLVAGAYGGGLEEVDFRDGAAAAARINDWVATETRDRIDTLVRPGDVQNASLVLTNAIYFKGTWRLQFDPEKTRTAPFFIAPGRSTDVDMMEIKETFLLYEDDDAQVIELPYEGDRLSMVIILPRDAEAMQRIEAQLGGEQWRTWLAGMEPREIKVFLPRFTSTRRYVLNDVMRTMGMPLAFTAAADFSGMTGAPGLFIGQVIHKADIEVNEQGAEAAAATAVTMLRSAVGEPVFRADHPFIYAIRDTETDAVLFVGRLADPSS